jgi:hypothetical protein
MAKLGKLASKPAQWELAKMGSLGTAAQLSYML